MHTIALSCQYQRSHPGTAHKHSLPQPFIDLQHGIYESQLAALYQHLEDWTHAHALDTPTHIAIIHAHSQQLKDLIHTLYHQLEGLQQRLAPQATCLESLSAQDGVQFQRLYQHFQTYGIELFFELTPVNLLIHHDIRMLHAAYHARLSTLDFDQIILELDITHSGIITFWRTLCYELWVALDLIKQGLQQTFEDAPMDKPADTDTTHEPPTFEHFQAAFRNNLRQDISNYCLAYLTELSLTALSHSTPMDRLMVLGLTLKQICRHGLFVDFDHFMRPPTPCPTDDATLVAPTRLASADYTPIDRHDHPIRLALSQLAAAAPRLTEEVQVMHMDPITLHLDMIHLSCHDPIVEVIHQQCLQYLTEQLSRHPTFTDVENSYLIAQLLLSTPWAHAPNRRSWQNLIDKMQQHSQHTLQQTAKSTPPATAVQQGKDLLEGYLFQHPSPLSQRWPHWMESWLNPKTKIIHHLNQIESQRGQASHPMPPESSGYHALCWFMLIQFSFTLICLMSHRLMHYLMQNTWLRDLPLHFAPPTGVTHWYASKLLIWATQMALLLTACTLLMLFTYRVIKQLAVFIDKMMQPPPVDHITLPDYSPTPSPWPPTVNISTKSRKWVDGNLPSRQAQLSQPANSPSESTPIPPVPS